MDATQFCRVKTIAQSDTNACSLLAGKGTFDNSTHFTSKDMLVVLQIEFRVDEI